MLAPSTSRCQRATSDAATLELGLTVEALKGLDNCSRIGSENHRIVDFLTNGSAIGSDNERLLGLVDPHRSSWLLHRQSLGLQS